MASGQSKANDAVKYLERRLRQSGLADVRVVLFGSQAGGTATEQSDVDVVIVSTTFRGKDVFERARLTQDAEVEVTRRYMLPFDIMTLTPEEFESHALASEFVK